VPSRAPIHKGPDGNIWFAENDVGDPGSHVVGIGRITPRGHITSFSLPATVGRAAVVGITLGPDRALWFTVVRYTTAGDADAGVVGHITTSGAVTLYPLPREIPTPIHTHEELRSGFANQVMLALPWMRNHLGGHGQGREEQALPEPFARLALGLAAVINEFIVSLAIERDASLVRVTDRRPSRGASVSVDESDFVPASMARDDDIPF